MTIGTEAKAAAGKEFAVATANALVIYRNMHLANEEVPKLTKVAAAVLGQAGIRIGHRQAGKSIDPKYKSRLEFADTQPKINAMLASITIKEGHALTKREGAEAAAVTAAQVIQLSATSCIRPPVSASPCTAFLTARRLN